MGNVLRFKCADCANADQRQRRKITIVLVGLDNAGKTCTVKSIMREKQKNILPTVGFSSSKFNYLDNAITIYDLGGHKQIRDIWEQYFPDVHGVIFVVDSTDHRRLDECKGVFRNLLENEKIAGKPVLLLANKQDKPRALDELDVVDRLNVETVVNANKCPTLVETCTALHSTSVSYFSSVNVDPSIDSGFSWLVSQIVRQYDALDRRVTEDMAQYKANADKKMEAWKKNRQTSTDSYLLSFNAPHRRSTRRNPFRRINKVIQDSIESKTSNSKTDRTGTGSTSYIIPLRSESDEEADVVDEPEPVAFRNKVAPTAVESQPGQTASSVHSRSPLFRARSREYDRDESAERRGSTVIATDAAATANATATFSRNESSSAGTAKTKRSLFSRKSNSTSDSGKTVKRLSARDRPNSVKSQKDSASGPQHSTDEQDGGRSVNESRADDVDEEDVVMTGRSREVSADSPEAVNHM